MADSDTIQTTLDHHDLTLTRLSKVLYPAARFTKAHVVDYYVRAAPWLLPHLRDRPLTLKRYPDSIQSKAFWEKDAPSFTPDWVTRFPVARRAGGADIHYILANNAVTLAWLANIATLELHPFLHCVPNLSAPTSVVFDLDPGEGTNLLHCIDLAFLIRQLLENFGLQLFPKVSGSKGLQLYLPLNTPVTYAITQPFARSVALLIETQHPDLAVSDMAKHKRTNKVFIDWSQNADFKTTVAVYSLRAQRDYPFVSMPVLWTELEAVRNSRNPDPVQFDPPPPSRDSTRTAISLSPSSPWNKPSPPTSPKA
ncbi:MAG: primase-like protein [Bryobacterales bacterium]|nr:primase-like protein [Bryobacterales bacterium]